MTRPSDTASPGAPPLIEPLPEATPALSSSLPLPRPLGRLRAWPHLMLAGGCALIISLLITSFWQSSLGLEAVSSVQAQSERNGRLDRLQLRLVDAETGVRGYLLTGEPVYLEPYEAAITGLDQKLTLIGQDFADLPASTPAIAELRELVDDKLRVMAEAVAQRTMADQPTGDIVGKELMDQIRHSLDGLRQQLGSASQRSIDQSVLRFRQTRFAVIALATGALVLLLMLFNTILRQLQLREEIGRLLLTENERLDALVQARTAELSSLASYLTNSREMEKARLARELHDELGALLTAAKMDASAVARKLPPEVLAPLKPNLDRLRDTLSSGIALKRRIIDDLRPPLLQDLGLVAALRALGDDFALGNEQKVVLTLPEEVEDETPEITGERALALFRITQEALTNIRKYAQAQQVELELGFTAGHAELRVADDGIGFDPKRATTGHHGLAGMRHRVQMFAGSFVLDSSPGKGTRIMVRIPLA